MFAIQAKATKVHHERLMTSQGPFDRRVNRMEFRAWAPRARRNAGRLAGVPSSGCGSEAPAGLWLGCPDRRDIDMAVFGAFCISLLDGTVLHRLHMHFGFVTSSLKLSSLALTCILSH